MASLGDFFRQNRDLHVLDRLDFIERVLEDLLEEDAGVRRPIPPGDPGPEDLRRVRRIRRWRWPWPGPGPGDPGPVELQRLSLLELEDEIHRLNAEKVRIDAALRTVEERHKELKGSAKKEG